MDLNSKSNFSDFPYVIRKMIVVLVGILGMIPVQHFRLKNPVENPRNFHFIFLDLKRRGQTEMPARQRAKIAQKIMKNIYPFVSLNHQGAVLTVTVRYKTLCAHFEDSMKEAFVGDLERIRRKMQKK